MFWIEHLLQESVANIERKIVENNLPNALRLADALDVVWAGGIAPEAAAELRRLHTLCGEWEKKAATWLASPQAAQRLDGYRELAQRLNAAEAVNQELVEALRALIDMDVAYRRGPKVEEAVEYARAAIAKADGQT